jgi:hypothetical protein
MYCEKCGSSVNEGAQFCPSCGTTVAASQAPVTDANAALPVPQPQPQQVPPRPVATETSESRPMFESKKLSIALIITSIVWWLGNVVSLAYMFLFLTDSLHMVFMSIVLPSIIVLVIIGMREIRWSREAQADNGIIGFADIVLAISLLLLFVFEINYDVIGYTYFQLGLRIAFCFLGLIAMAIAAVLLILVVINRKKAGQRMTALRVASIIFMVFTLLDVLMLARIVAGQFSVFVFYDIQLFISDYWTIILIPMYSILLAALITRAVDLFPRHQRVARAVGAPTGGSVATVNPLDAPSGGFAVLCFFMPLVGLILYLVWKDEYPLKAKSCGKGALIGAIVIFGLSCLLTVLMVAVPLLMML